MAIQCRGSPRQRRNRAAICSYAICLACFACLFVVDAPGAAFLPASRIVTDRRLRSFERGPAGVSRGTRTSAAAVATVAEQVRVAPAKRKSGGGGGGGPPPADQARVVIYRGALLLAALSWAIAYSLDFFMTSGISAIDGTVQAAALKAADVFAAIAALVVPTGSVVLAGVLSRLLGAATLGAAVLGMAGPGTLGSAAGPACVVLVCARDVYWFGLAYKVDAAAAVLLFIAITLLRVSAAIDATQGSSVSEIQVSSQQPMEYLKRDAVLEEGDVMDFANSLAEVQPIGPPVPLSFAASVSLVVLSMGKLFEPLAEDLDEEGEQWAKESSRSLYDDEETYKSQTSSKDKQLEQDE